MMINATFLQPCSLRMRRLGGQQQPRPPRAGCLGALQQSLPARPQFPQGRDPAAAVPTACIASSSRSGCSMDTRTPWETVWADWQLSRMACWARSNSRAHSLARPAAHSCRC